MNSSPRLTNFVTVKDPNAVITTTASPSITTEQVYVFTTMYEEEECTIANHYDEKKQHKHECDHGNEEHQHNDKDEEDYYSNE